MSSAEWISFHPIVLNCGGGGKVPGTDPKMVETKYTKYPQARLGCWVCPSVYTIDKAVVIKKLSVINL